VSGVNQKHRAVGGVTKASNATGLRFRKLVVPERRAEGKVLPSRFGLGNNLFRCINYSRPAPLLPERPKATDGFTLNRHERLFQMNFLIRNEG